MRPISPPPSTMNSPIAALVLAAFALGGCDPTPPVPPATAAATVEGRVAESELATVRLTEDAERRLGIETRAVERRAVPRARSYAAEIVAPPDRTIRLVAPFAARVHAGEVAVRPGERVAAAAVLFTLEPIVSPDGQALSPAERTAMARARADLELLAAELDAAIATGESEVEADRIAAARASALLDAGSGSARERDEAAARLALCERRLESARARRSALEKITLDGTAAAPDPLAVAAPWSATIVAPFASAGQPVAAGSPLVELADLEELWLRVDAPVADAAELAPDAEAIVEPRAGARDPAQAAAPVRAAPVPSFPRGDFGRATLERWFRLAPADSARFRPGERVSATIALASAGDALVVPAAAIVRDVHGGTWVYVRREARAYARARVELERVDGALAVLARGPPRGTEVVVAGAAELFGTEFGAGK